MIEKAKKVVHIFGDQTGSITRALLEAQSRGNVSEGFSLVGVPPCAFGVGAGHPPPEEAPKDFLKGHTPWGGEPENHSH